MKFLTDCNEVMDKYFSLDKGDKVPLAVTLHLITCKECRRQVKAMKAAERIARAPLEIPVEMTDFSIEAVMAKIDPNYSYSKNPISIAKWIIGGIAMILLMLTFGLSEYCSANKTVMITFYTLFAGCVTAYCALFIGTNMDFFVKLMETKKETNDTINNSIGKSF